MCVTMYISCDNTVGTQPGTLKDVRIKKKITVESFSVLKVYFKKRKISLKHQSNQSN